MNTSITAGQKKQYVIFGEDALEKALTEAGLDKDGIQKFIERGDEFQADIIASITRLSVNNQYAYEEKEFSYGYKPKAITEQVNRLRELSPGIGYADEKLVEQDLPPNAEGWFAIPRWEKIAPTYGEAVQKVLDLIKKTRDGAFCNYRENRLGHQYLRQSQKSIKLWEGIGESQKDNDILVVPAQFGLRHRGRSVRRAREVMNAQEFGLGAFAVGIMLLTHPERLQDYDDLYIDCAGDEYSPSAFGGFPSAPLFNFDDDRVKFSTYWVSSAFSHCGPASGLVVLPQ